MNNKLVKEDSGESFYFPWQYKQSSEPAKGRRSNFVEVDVLCTSWQVAHSTLPSKKGRAGFVGGPPPCTA